MVDFASIKRRSRNFLRFPSIRARIELVWLVMLLASCAAIWVTNRSDSQSTFDIRATQANLVAERLAFEAEHAATAYLLRARFVLATNDRAAIAPLAAAEDVLRHVIARQIESAPNPRYRDAVRELGKTLDVLSEGFERIAFLKRANVASAGKDLAQYEVSIQRALIELTDSAAILPAVQNAAQDIRTRISNVSNAVEQLAVGNDQIEVSAIAAQIGAVGELLGAAKAKAPELKRQILAVESQLTAYRTVFAVIGGNIGRIAAMTKEMATISATMVKQVDAMSTDAQVAVQTAQSQMADTPPRQPAMALAAIILIYGCGLAFAIGRSVSAPVKALTQSVRALASGQADINLKERRRGDEVGQIARAIEALQLRNQSQAARSIRDDEETSRVELDERRAQLANLTREFEVTIGAIVANVATSATQLEGSASILAQTSQATQSALSLVAVTSDDASSHVQTVAHATGELSETVDTIGRQVLASNRIADAAVVQARNTDERIAKLSKAAEQIGDVVKLINAIAARTNLLALNATIEAVRAGDAGRSFATVAQEVKSLAGQTALATSKISQQVGDIQAATLESVSAIKQIGATIGEISGIAMEISIAVDQQNAVTYDITNRMLSVVSGTENVASNIRQMSGGAREASRASTHVLDSARGLSEESLKLRKEVDAFLRKVRTA